LTRVANIPIQKSIIETPEGAKMVTLADAKRVIAAAEKKAEQIGQPMNVAVVDAGGGNLVAHVRMNGAWIGSIDISIHKAFTARAFDISTRKLGPLSQPGRDFYGIHASNHGRIMICGRDSAEARGEDGGSGRRQRGTGAQDQQVAEAGAGGVLASANRRPAKIGK
jgi:uncharacterized protein GlcG (DUF336 family)